MIPARKIGGVVLALLGGAGTLRAARPTAVDFLTVFPSVRAYSLAGNAVGLSGADSVGLNPANVGRMEKRWGVYTTFFEPVTGSAYSHLALAFKPGSATPAFSFAATHIKTDSDPQTDSAGNIIGDSLPNQDLAFAVGMAGRALTHWHWGLNLRTVQSELAGVKSNKSWGGDAGLSGEVRKVKVGAYVRNAGTGIQFYSDSDPLPTELSLEARVPYRMFRFAGGFHRNIPKDQNAFSLAAEGAAGPLMFRGGYRFETAKTGASAEDNFFFGIGGILGAFSLDYGVTQRATQNDYQHRVGISAEWGGAGKSTASL